MRREKRELGCVLYYWCGVVCDEGAGGGDVIEGRGQKFRCVAQWLLIYNVDLKNIRL